MKNKSQFKEFARYSTLNVLGNLAIPVYSFIHGSGLMLGIGGATKYSIFKSNKENKNANTIFTNTLCLATVLSIGFVLIGIFLSKSLTTALGADSDVFKMTNTYLQFILIFAPAFIMNDVLICFVRNDNSPKLSMYAMLGGSLSNIILDYIFIFPLQLGIFGAVFATGLAPIISMLILSLHRIKRKNQFHFIKIKPSIKIARNTLSLGFPSLVTEVSSGIVIIVFNMIILNLIGNVGVAAYGIVANLSLVVVAVYTGIAQGIQPLISKSYGGNDIKSIKLIFKYAMITMSIISFILYLIIFFLADPIAKIFNSENNLVLQSIATNGLKLYFMAVIFVGFNIILPMLFSSMEKAFLAQIISLLRGLVVIIPMAFILSALVGLTGVWLAFPITESLVSILGVILYLKLRI
ncbi:MATE family efflux transporter [Clostridium sp.]|uniref:MATE family efflux transporter n=1 Tax=Clostridium sp. TaxID=1506 RepID=UPI0029153464|nr:MATE family efflux transporter [Clostridium sp.]MDU4427189.1 MATE family efflux transporter [Clostridium sp.]